MAIQVGGNTVIDNGLKITGNDLTIGDVVYAKVKGTKGQVLAMNTAEDAVEFADIASPLTDANAGDGIDISDTPVDPTIKVDLASPSAGLYFNSNKLDIQKASDTNFGTVQIGSGINVTDGVISVDLGAIQFRGGVDLTSEDPTPANPVNGDAYINKVSGEASNRWGAAADGLTAGNPVESGDIVVYDEANTKWVYVSGNDAPGTDLEYKTNATDPNLDATLESSTGDNATIPVAVIADTDNGLVGAAGLFTGAEKEKLANIQEGATAGGDGLWTEAGGKLSPATLTNDVLVGGADAAAAKIQLNANGSAEFAGGATEISSSGAIAVNRTAGTNDIFAGLLNDSATSRIKADGSAEFGSASSSPSARHTITAYNSSPDTETTATFFAHNNAGGRLWKGSNGSAETSTIYADGSATFEGLVTANEAFRSNRTGSGQACFSARLNNVENALISADGSATFAGQLVAGKVSNDTKYFRWRDSDGVTIYDNVATGSSELFKVITNDGSTLKTQVSFTANGAATFASTITAGGYSFANLQEL